MSNIIGRKQFGNSRLEIQVDDDPRNAGGTPAPKTTRAVNGADIYIKTGDNDIDWTPISNFGSGLEMANGVFADSKAVAGGDGTAEKPFASLQAAIDFMEANFQPEERKVIYVNPDSAFDEDILVTGGIMHIMGLGPWTLGDAAGAAFASTVARNFTYEVVGALPDGKWPSLVIGTIFDNPASSTHTAYLNGCTISGAFTVTDPGGANNSHNIQLTNVKVVGNYDTTATVGGWQTYFKRCLFQGTVNSPSGIFNIVDDTQFDDLITALQYNRITKSEIKAGMTVTATTPNSLPPNGMIFTTFTGVFTGPALSLRLDGVSNFYFKANGAALAGGATKVIIDDLVA